jgi:ABC-type transport system substrate-binding protein
MKFVMSVRACVVAGLLAVLAVHAQQPPASAPAKKVLRYAFEVAETSLDPVQINDLYSRMITAHLYEGMYHYDHLARPTVIEPLTADGMPQVSADFRVWTVKIRPGIYFADDLAFKGKRRELVAQDYVYTYKRFADPANKSQTWTDMESEGIIGLAELRREALETKKPFDYDREIEGLRAIDRYTLRFSLRDPRPRYLENMTQGDLLGAVAREVVEYYGAQIVAHPVGTGPYRLAEWRRSSFIALERNPDFREMFYDAAPAADDAEGQALLARFKGRRLPMVDRVEISIIEEEQPRWLSFVNGEADMAYRVGYQFVTQAMPNGRVAPNLAKRGIRGYRIVEPAINYYFFNMDDPMVGGYGADRIALRRAIGLGMDTATVIAYAYSGQGIVAQSPLLPSTSAFDPKLKTEMGDYDPARANALLDLYGYMDRDGDGWRDMPDGSPLVLRVATQADQRSRKIAEVLDKNMKVLRIRTESITAQWPENLKAARTGRLQMWSVGSFATAPDAVGALARFDGRQIGGQDMARFKLPAMDAIFDQVQLLPDGPKRLALFREAEKLAVAYMPYKFTLNRLSIDMTQPQLIGYRRPIFWLDFWQYVDIDDSLRRPR